MYNLFNKLKSCRNKRKKYKYNLVWPTKVISKKKSKLLQKNNRKFMIELGKPIKLKFKIKIFKMLKQGTFTIRPESVKTN